MAKSDKAKKKDSKGSVSLRQSSSVSVSSSHVEVRQTRKTTVHKTKTRDETGKIVETESISSTIEDAHSDDGVRGEAYVVAAKRAISWDVEQTMRSQKLSQAAMADRMNVSASQLEQLLDPEDTTVQFDTIVKAAQVLGRKLKIELV